MFIDLFLSQESADIPEFAQVDMICVKIKFFHNFNKKSVYHETEVN